MKEGYNFCLQKRLRAIGLLKRCVYGRQGAAACEDLQGDRTAQDGGAAEATRQQDSRVARLRNRPGQQSAGRQSPGRQNSKAQDDRMRDDGAAICKAARFNLESPQRP